MQEDGQESSESHVEHRDIISWHSNSCKTNNVKHFVSMYIANLIEHRV